MSQTDPLINRNVTTADLDVEQAETHTVEAVERNLHAAFLAHRPPQPPPMKSLDDILGTSESTEETAAANSRPPTSPRRSSAFSALIDAAKGASGDDANANGGGEKKATLKDVARRVKLAKQMSERRNNIGNRHRKAKSHAEDILKVIQHDDDFINGAVGENITGSDSVSRANGRGSRRGGFGAARPRTSSSDLLGKNDVFDAAAHAFVSHGLLPATEEETENSGDEATEVTTDASQQPDYGSTTLPSTSSPPDEASLRSGRRGNHRRKSNWRKFKRQCSQMMSPKYLAEIFLDFFWNSFIIMVTIPCVLLSVILITLFNNPTFDFIPWDTTASFWLMFIARQAITLELARIAQWLLVDKYFTNPRYGVQWFGPYVTFFFLQSKGWPFLGTGWALFDFALLFGDSKFDADWFYWSGWRTSDDSGTFVLHSDFYTRILGVMVLAGIATAVKRTYLAIRFGRRQFAEFKPKLEKIIKEVLVVSEVAIIAEEIEKLEEMGELMDAGDVKSLNTDKRKSGWKGVTFQENASIASSVDDEEEEDEDSYRGSRRMNRQAPRLSHTMSGSFRIKKFLDRWNDPVEQSERDGNASISNVLKFRTALGYMDDCHPFGEAFGPASNRNECIESSHNVYWRLLRFTPGRTSLPFDTIGIAASEDGTVKTKELKKVFRPDIFDELTKLAFIQSIDQVYRKLRFFRATVRNASVIDECLEDIINGLFYFVLSLALLSLLHFNPWPLLVSLTSLLVSVSFALGSSLSKYVEGLLLIAVRRPFDLGDRIILTGAETIDNPGVPATWFVEDITLYSTTLRYARTNEVCSINNSSIASSRIVNCNRSPNAIVTFPLRTHASIFDKENMQKFRNALEEFVGNATRIWESIAFVRVDDIDADNEISSFTLGFVHRSTWQDAGRILLNKSDLLRFVYDLTKRLKIQVDSPPARRLLFHGGSLETTNVQYKRFFVEENNLFRHSLARQETNKPPLQRDSSIDVDSAFNNLAPGS